MSGDHRRGRPLRPRATSALSVAPATVTDRTCAAVLGLEPRTFRDLVTRHKTRHARIGRRIVARIEDVLALLDRLASEDGAPGETPDAETSTPSGVDGVLARIGRRRVSP